MQNLKGKEHVRLNKSTVTNPQGALRCLHKWGVVGAWVGGPFLILHLEHVDNFRNFTLSYVTYGDRIVDKFVQHW